MRSDLVVVTTPLFSQHLSLLQAVEDFPIQKLISELAIERFTVADYHGLPGSMNKVLEPTSFGLLAGLEQRRSMGQLHFNLAQQRDDLF